MSHAADQGVASLQLLVHEDPFVAGPDDANADVSGHLQRGTDSVSVDVVGELDLVSAPVLSRWVAEQVGEGRRHIRLDLTRLSFCDARGLSALIDVREHVDEAGGELVLAGAPPILRRAIRVTGLEERLPIQPDAKPA